MAEENPKTEEEQLNEELAKLSKKERSALGTISKMFKSTTRKGDVVLKSVKNMAKATRFSQDAQRMYWDLDKGEQKTKPNFEKAKEMCDKAIRLLDEAAADFPQILPALQPIKDKILLQKKDIELQLGGFIAGGEKFIDKDALKHLAEMDFWAEKVEEGEN